MTAEADLVRVALARNAIRDATLACTRCYLGQRPHSTLFHGPVPFRGPAPSRVMIVGEAPGRTEDNARRPFVGQAGRLLRDSLGEVHLDLDGFFVTNALRCLPPTTPESACVKECLRHLRAELVLCNPEWVLILGNVALSTAQLKGTSISRVHGRCWDMWYGPYIGRKVFATYHPAAALRDESGSTLGKFQQDLSTVSGIFAGTVSADAHRIEIGRGGKPDFNVRYVSSSSSPSS